ncbi:hypothetical protein F5146DRAFT_705570 [Armillaria mellea]|nr:hypothetical protein F5146DRAFT_705570 [Armillaria mellea]
MESGLKRNRHFTKMLKAAVELRNVIVKLRRVVVKQQLLSRNHRLVSVNFKGGWKVSSAPLVLPLQFKPSCFIFFLIVAIVCFRVIHRYRSRSCVQLLSVNYLALLYAMYIYTVLIPTTAHKYDSFS